MRNFLTISGLLLVTACSGGIDEMREPPVLQVTSPQRSLVQNGAGAIKVTGTVAPNEEGTAVEKVVVNGVQATVNPDGTFQATITVEPGATLIHTVARDAHGTEATDTRAVHAGELRPAGANIERAVAAAISTDAFAKIAAAAGPLVEGMDMGAMLAPMNPMVHKGDESGEDCLFGRVFIDDVNFSNFEVTLVPVNGGLQFRAQIDELDVPGRARYAVACADGSNNVRVRATRVVVGGTLLVSPNGMMGFTTELADPDVQITGLDIQASGIPGTILDMLNLESAIQFVIAKGAELAMDPLMNSALGALAGPKSLEVLGHNMSVEAVPADISFDVAGGLVVMDMRMLLEGAEGKGFIYTENGMPNLDPGNGFQIGLADDLANEMMAEAGALGLLNLAMPAAGGTFDNAEIAMTLPPMISADPADGQMRVILGDMVATFTNQGTPVAKAAINASIELKIEPANNGYGIAIQLGKPEIQVNVLDDLENTTRFLDKDLAQAVEVCLNAQISSISKLLGGIPLPAVAGLQMRDLSVGAADGYVLLQGAFD